MVTKKLHYGVNWTVPSFLKDKLTIQSFPLVPLPCRPKDLNVQDINRIFLIFASTPSS